MREILIKKLEEFCKEIQFHMIPDFENKTSDFFEKLSTKKQNNKAMMTSANIKFLSTKFINIIDKTLKEKLIPNLQTLRQPNIIPKYLDVSILKSSNFIVPFALRAFDYCACMTHPLSFRSCLACDKCKHRLLIT